MLGIARAASGPYSWLSRQYPESLGVGCSSPSGGHVEARHRHPHRRDHRKHRARTHTVGAQRRRGRASIAGGAACTRPLSRNAWNWRDPADLVTSLQFDVRPGAGPFKLATTPRQYVAGIDFEQTAMTGWDHTEWVSRRSSAGRRRQGARGGNVAALYQGRTGACDERHQIACTSSRISRTIGACRRGCSRAGGLCSGRVGSEPGCRARRAQRVRRSVEFSRNRDARARGPLLLYVPVADRQIEMWNDADEFIAGTEAGRQRTWYQMRVDQVRPEATANGVNLVLGFSRLARDGSVMSKDEGLFLATSRRRWKIQARLTFGTKTLTCAGGAIRVRFQAGCGFRPTADLYAVSEAGRTKAVSPFATRVSPVGSSMLIGKSVPAAALRASN